VISVIWKNQLKAFPILHKIFNEAFSINGSDSNVLNPTVLASKRDALRPFGSIRGGCSMEQVEI
jgi:hypothetical protein